MVGAPGEDRAQPTSNRRPSSEALISGNPGNSKVAGEAEERLRRSMQTWGSSNKGGMVRWSSAAQTRPGGCKENQSRTICAQHYRNDMQLPAQSRCLRVGERGVSHQPRSTDKKDNQPSSGRQLRQSMNPMNMTASRRASATTPQVHARPPPSPALGPTKPLRGAEASSFRHPPARLTAAAVNQNSPALDPRPTPDTVSEAGTHAAWWRPDSSSASVVSYPMTAVTDRAGSVASTELRLWMERLNQLESAVSDERSKRKQFEEELRKLQSDSMFQVSSGYLTTGKPSDSIAANATKSVIR